MNGGGGVLSEMKQEERDENVIYLIIYSKHKTNLGENED